MAALGDGAPALPLETPPAVAARDDDWPLPADVWSGADELTDGAGPLATWLARAGVEVLTDARLLAAGTTARPVEGVLDAAAALGTVDRPLLARPAALRWLAEARRDA